MKGGAISGRRAHTPLLQPAVAHQQAGRASHTACKLVRSAYAKGGSRFACPDDGRGDAAMRETAQQRT